MHIHIDTIIEAKLKIRHTVKGPLIRLIIQINFGKNHII